MPEREREHMKKDGEGEEEETDEGERKEEGVDEREERVDNREGDSTENLRLRKNPHLHPTTRSNLGSFLVKFRHVKTDEFFWWHDSHRRRGFSEVI